MIGASRRKAGESVVRTGTATPASRPETSAPPQTAVTTTSERRSFRLVSAPGLLVLPLGCHDELHRHVALDPGALGELGVLDPRCERLPAADGDGLLVRLGVRDGLGERGRVAPGGEQEENRGGANI